MATIDKLCAAFNKWAKNPKGNPPAEFAYIKESPKIKKDQSFTISEKPTGWITSVEAFEVRDDLGNIRLKKLLFPNPAAFDKNTDIDKFYHLDARDIPLGPKGKNAAVVIVPIIMTAMDYININEDGVGKGRIKLRPMDTQSVSSKAAEINRSRGRVIVAGMKKQIPQRPLASAARANRTSK